MSWIEKKKNKVNKKRTITLVCGEWDCFGDVSLLVFCDDDVFIGCNGTFAELIFALNPNGSNILSLITFEFFVLVGFVVNAPKSKFKDVSGLVYGVVVVELSNAPKISSTFVVCGFVLSAMEN